MICGRQGGERPRGRTEPDLHPRPYVSGVESDLHGLGLVCRGRWCETADLAEVLVDGLGLREDETVGELDERHRKAPFRTGEGGRNVSSLLARVGDPRMVKDAEDDIGATCEALQGGCARGAGFFSRGAPPCHPASERPTLHAPW